MDPATLFEQSRLRLLRPFFERLEQVSDGAVGRALASGEDVWRLGADKLQDRLGDAINGDDLRAIFAEAAAELAQPRPQPTGRTVQHLSEASTFALAVEAAQKLRISLLELTGDQLKVMGKWGAIEQFSMNLAVIFGKYRDAWTSNKLLLIADEENGTKTSLSNEAFLAAFGPPPWDTVNNTLAAFQLPYEVNRPRITDFSQVSVYLNKIPSGETVSFDNLSSGEKVLFQLAISTFQPDEFFVTIQRPKVLLLDEMDASLHPEMVHRWLRAIQSVLVEAQGMHCIITTHSPTTVALAPDDALFEMVDGRAGLAKISKQEALNRLTFGVPTLSINYSGRRQVFAESDTDAAIYEGFYALIKSHIRCERELNFLSTGLRDKNNGEINAGCTIVKQTVDRLSGDRNPRGARIYSRRYQGRDEGSLCRRQ